MRRNWLLVEAIVLTLPAASMILLFVPYLPFAFVEIISPIPSDGRDLAERIFGLLPVTGGAFGIAVIWRYVVLIAGGKFRRAGIDAWIAMPAGVLACFEVFRTIPVIVAAGICVPVWALAAHLVFIIARAKKAAPERTS